MHRILNLILERDHPTRNIVTLAKCCDHLLARVEALEKEVNARQTHPPNPLEPLDQKGQIVQMKIRQ